MPVPAGRASMDICSIKNFFAIKAEISIFKLHEKILFDQTIL